MSRYVVELASAAEADIRAAFTGYRERNALIADAFRAEAVIYEVHANTVTVLAVAHHRRRPGYWTSMKG